MPHVSGKLIAALCGVAAALAFLALVFFYADGPGTLRCTVLGEVKQSALKAREGGDGLHGYAKRETQIYNDLVQRYDYYACESFWYGVLWNVGTLTVMVLTSLTALLAAMDFGKRNWGRATLATLPALAALLGAVLTQFRLQETWVLREAGRIEVGSMLDRVRRIEDNDPKKLETLNKVQDEAIDLERVQARQFFSTLFKGEQRETPPASEKR